MTTTDPFTEAAVDAAEDARERALGGPPNGAYDGHFLLGFRMGSTWARTHPAAQEPDDIEVLAAMTAYEGHPDRVSAWRAALSAAWSARAARRDEEKR